MLKLARNLSNVFNASDTYQIQIWQLLEVGVQALIHFDLVREQISMQDKM